MNMKKIASVALAAALSASLLAGCGGGSEGGSDSVTPVSYTHLPTR